MKLITCGLLAAAIFLTPPIQADPPYAPTPAPIPRPTAQELHFASQASRARIRALTDDQIIHEYRNPGHFVNLAMYDIISRSTEREEYPDLLLTGDVCAEILRRGQRMVPPLVSLLSLYLAHDSQAVSSRYSGVSHFHSEGVMGLLSHFRCLASAQALVNVLSTAPKTPEYPENDQRYHTLAALERLTYCSYFHSTPMEGTFDATIPRLDATLRPHSERYSYTKIAAFYHTWLLKEAHDPQHWLALARQRARRLLSGDDPDAVYCAASFMQRSRYIPDEGPPHEDAPKLTAGSVARILNQAQRGGVADEYQGLKYYAFNYHGKLLLPSVGNWTELLAAYGHLAQPYADILVRIQKQRGLYEWNGFGDLDHVGGRTVVSYFMDRLPELDAALTAIGQNRNPYISLPLDIDKLPPDELGKSLILAYRVCRFGVDSAAGRTFNNDDERREWWTVNRSLSEAQWLRKGLPIGAAQADSGNQEAQAILRAAVPDLPPDAAEPFWSDIYQIGGTQNPTPSPPFRVQWLKLHWKSLHYDPATNSLRLR